MLRADVSDGRFPNASAVNASAFRLEKPCRKRYLPAGMFRARAAVSKCAPSGGSKSFDFTDVVHANIATVPSAEVSPGVSGAVISSPKKSVRMVNPIGKVISKTSGKGKGNARKKRRKKKRRMRAAAVIARINIHGRTTGADRRP